MKKSTKRTLNKIRIFILKLLTIIAGVLFVLSILSLDTESFLPVVIWITSGAWLTLILYANGYMK